MQEITRLSHTLPVHDGTAIILYNQRKLVPKQGFPLVIDTFLIYFWRKYIEIRRFPLVIEYILLYLQRINK